MSETKPSPAVLMTEEDAAKAFELWERKFRAAPDDFKSGEEIRVMDRGELARSKAAYFMEMLREVDGVVESMA